MTEGCQRTGHHRSILWTLGKSCNEFRQPTCLPAWKLFLLVSKVEHIPCAAGFNFIQFDLIYLNLIWKSCLGSFLTAYKRHSPPNWIPMLARFISMNLGMETSFLKNIAKSTTDPRVEFISQVYSSQFTNLDQIIIQNLN